MRYEHELLHLCRFEPGATLDRAVERIAGQPSREALQRDVEALERAGRLERLGDGWRTVPEPDPLDVARKALEDVVAEPDGEKMTRIAQDALAAIDPGT